MDINKAFPKAKDIFFEENKKDTFPEDDWISIGKYWDLNLWTDEIGKHRATLYPVKNGFTQTLIPIRVA